MSGRAKVTVSIDRERLDDLDLLSRRRGVSRSRMVEVAIDLLRRNELEERLREGYLSMAIEDREVAESLLPAAREVME